MAKKAASQAVKDQAAAATSAAAEDQEWAKGAKSNAKSSDAAAKADEALRKKREKEALFEAEEAENSGVKVKKVAPSKKKKKTDDFSLLEAGLTGAAEKAAKAKKKAEREKKEKEAKEAQEDADAAAAARAATSLTGNGIVDASEILGAADGELGSKLNKPLDGENSVTGIDASLSVFKFGAADADPHPETKMKAAHRAFQEKLLPQMKEDFPGLKLSQYKEKIFELWKKSPDNPLNAA